MEFVYSLINMLADMAPYLLLGFWWQACYMPLCRAVFTAIIFHGPVHGR